MISLEPPEGRRCETCDKVYSLNMFRPNGTVCRYCETGTNPPRVWQDKRNDKTTIVLKDHEQAAVDIRQNDSVLERNSEEKVNDNLKSNIDLEINIKDSSSVKEFANRIYFKYIYEITILLGCVKRWLSTDHQSQRIITWIFTQEDIKGILDRTNEQDITRLKDILKENIDNTYVDPTLIKASIRSLLRSSIDRKVRLVNFIDSYFQECDNKAEIVTNLKNDIMIEKKELGYEIPILDKIKKEDLDLHFRENQIYQLTLIETCKGLANEINNNRFIINKEHFENKIKEVINTNYTDLLKSTTTDKSRLEISRGIKSSYIYYGLSKDNNSIVSGLDGVSLLDLNKSSL